MIKTKIYVLTEPSGEIRYIGKTSAPLSERISDHLSDARRGKKSYKNNWIRQLFSKCVLPKIELLGEVEGQGCIEEQAWIDYGKKEGWQLTNLTNGGDGTSGYHHTEEYKAKMKIFKRRENLSPETLAKMRIVHSGIKHTEEHKEKIRKAMQGRIINQEWRRKISLANIGKKASPETIKKLSLSHMGIKLSEEAKRKCALCMLGRHHSKETLLKQSEARRNYWANKRKALAS